MKVKILWIAMQSLKKYDWGWTVGIVTQKWKKIIKLHIFMTNSSFSRIQNDTNKNITLLWCTQGIGLALQNILICALNFEELYEENL